ncbi:unnamed protein product [Symbiodinium natans]|uniref:LicD/FKTN/FKRP nucleotidyltransferase domain-containing protein n=1 Tax=Symbiodinium natans TaxID=878477 RepID=A0A812R0C6_9DINO|nr:unnamed protein product [Symbiodinium natans]
MGVMVAKARHQAKRLRCWAFPAHGKGGHRCPRLPKSAALLLSLSLGLLLVSLCYLNQRLSHVDVNYAPSRWIAPDLRTQRNSLIDLLREVDLLFTALNVEYFVFAGTALGVEREHDIIQHDTDVDVAIFKDQLHLLQQTRILPSAPERFALQIWGNHQNEGHLRDEAIALRLIDKQTGLYADVFLMDRSNPSRVKSAATSLALQGCYACPKSKRKRKQRWFNISTSIILPLRRCPTRLNITVSCVAQPEELLLYFYGPDWRIPKK